MIKKNVTIKNKLGLHARAAAKFVNHAARYASQLDVNHKGKQVNGKSIMGIMMLAASKGTELELQIDGEDEQEMLDDLVSLIDNKFDEAE